MVKRKKSKLQTQSRYKDILFKDKVDQCFQFTPISTTCPINPLSFKTVPIQ